MSDEVPREQINFMKFVHRYEDLYDRINIRLQEPPKDNNKTLARYFLAAGFSDFRSITELTASVKTQYNSQAELVSRATLELVFNYLFIIEDFSYRFDWYYFAAAYDQREAIKLVRNTYPTDPLFEAELIKQEKILDAMEKGKPANLPSERFPNIGKILENNKADKSKVRQCYMVNPLTLRFFSYMNQWVYSPISQNAHSRYFQVQGRAAPERQRLNDLFSHISPEKYADLVVGYHSKIVSRSFLFNLMLLSEVASYHSYSEFFPLLQSLWIDVNHGVEPEEVYELRYKEMLK